MNSPFPCRATLRIVVALLLLLAGVGVALILPASRGSAGRPAVTVLDPRLGILWVQTRKGSGTYYLPKDVYGCAGRLGSRLEGQLRQQAWRMGVNIRTLPAFRAGNGTNGRAFFVGYTLSLPPKSSEHLMAELVAGDGTVYPLRSAAGGGGGPPERSWNLWLLDSMPSYVTNYALHLKTQTNGPLAGEIQFAD